MPVGKADFGNRRHGHEYMPLPPADEVTTIAFQCYHCLMMSIQPMQNDSAETHVTPVKTFRRNGVWMMLLLSMFGAACSRPTHAADQLPKPQTTYAPDKTTKAGETR